MFGGLVDDEALVYPFTYEQLPYETRKKRKQNGVFSRQRTLRLLAFILAMMIGFFGGFLADAAFSGSTTTKADEFHSSPSAFVEDGSGDTLWDIAAAHCPEKMDIREYVDLLKESQPSAGKFDCAGAEAFAAIV